MNKFLQKYLENRPVFLSLIRSKEALLWQKYLPLKAPVLDVGCGDGFFCKTVFGKLDIGLDMPESRMEQAKSISAYNRLVEFDGVNIPLKSASVATAVSNCVLEHVENLGELLNDVNRVLKPGGKFLVTVMAKPWENNLFGSLIMGSTYKSWMRKKQVHVNILEARQWRKSFEQAGFRVVEAKGYLDSKACRWLDIAHYLSLPNLASYVIFKKWVMFKTYNLVIGKLLWKFLEKQVEEFESGAIFYVLEK